MSESGSNWRWILAAQGLTLSIVSVGLVFGAAWELAKGQRDPVVVGLFLAFFVATTIGGVVMARRNWPK